MDNSLLLLIIVKKGVNVELFTDWLMRFKYIHGFYPSFEDYINFLEKCLRAYDVRSFEGKLWCTKDYSKLSNVNLNYFEFGYLLTSFTLYGVIDVA